MIPLAIPAYIAALAIASNNPVEKECLQAWANAALWESWGALVQVVDGKVYLTDKGLTTEVPATPALLAAIKEFRKDGALLPGGDPRLIMSSGGGAVFGVAPNPAVERQIHKWLEDHPESVPLPTDPRMLMASGGGSVYGFGVAPTPATAREIERSLRANAPQKKEELKPALPESGSTQEGPKAPPIQESPPPTDAGR